MASDHTLFTHEGAGHRVVVNKQAAEDTASLVLQDGYSGRAEIGLAGDDDLHVKVSADGTAWREAVKIGRTDGALLVWDTAGPNPGGAYDTTTGVFTAPAAGLYLVNASFTSNGADLLSVDAEVNGAPVARAQIYPASWTIIDRTFLAPMQAGDALRFVVKESGSVYLGAPGAADGVTVLRLGR